MILAVAVLAAALSVVACGGSLRRLADLRLRARPAVGAALALQLATIAHGVPAVADRAAYLASYALAGWFCWANRRVPFLWLVALGGLANSVVVAANDGVMPASAGALARAGVPATRAAFRNSTDLVHPRLPLLGDVVGLAGGTPLANVVSLGDGLLVAGSLLLLHSVGASRPVVRLAERRRRRRPQMRHLRRPAPAPAP